jgi:hypothetical protein
MKLIHDIFLVVMSQQCRFLRLKEVYLIGSLVIGFFYLADIFYIYQIRPMALQDILICNHGFQLFQGQVVDRKGAVYRMNNGSPKKDFHKYNFIGENFYLDILYGHNNELPPDLRSRNLFPAVR